MAKNLRQEIDDLVGLLETVRQSCVDYVDIEGFMINKQDEIEYLERKINCLKRRLKFSIIE